jgi:putative SOS response-associated peptidase YedK
MCAQFKLKVIFKDLLKQFKARPTKELEHYELPDRIVPYQMAPVIIDHKGELIIKPMRFSLLPVWAKEPKLKFATFNARLDSVDTKATWKRPFLTQRCLVPITDFVEPIYDGEHAGHMVMFYEKGRQILAAAGIYDHWVNSQTGEVIDSFAIITDESSPFIRSIGHERQPVFLKPEGYDLWLRGGKRDPENLKSILHAYRLQPTLEVENDRPMKAGWEKRKLEKSLSLH